MTVLGNNPFVLKLLALQQDGSGSISSPSNWVSPPMLEVETWLDPIIDKVCAGMLIGGEPEPIARWHFFVGSPGNGKSAAVGKLCRKLRERGCSLMARDEGVEINELGRGQVPYLVEVIEDQNAFSSAWLVQDASVVKNPYSRDVDPAGELVRLLEDAWHAGVSLVLCTNRGVIEKAFRNTYLNPDRNTKPWFKVMRDAVDWSTQRETLYGFDADCRRRKPFTKFKFTHEPLDDRSLLIGDDTFERLMQKAIGVANWAECKDCSSGRFCPFKLNREWITNETGRKNLLGLLRRAELFGGQIIVFREAIALLSFILAGCPRDYTSTPCEWVHERIGLGDLFSLLSRRIYMSLFSSYASLGLEHDESLHQRQRECLQDLVATETIAVPERNALTHALEYSNSVSTDVGVTRLLGASGVLRGLDPLNELLSSSFHDTWDSRLDAITSSGLPFISQLESNCFEYWKSAEKAIEASTIDSGNRFAWLRRWITAFTLRLGALVEGHSAFRKELDELLEMITLLRKGGFTERELRRIEMLNTHLRSILGSATGEGIALSEFATLAGRWVETRLEPSIAVHTTTKSMGLPIVFGEDRGVKSETSMNALVFAWLSRRADMNMADCSFPVELVRAVKDARARAAAASEYAHQDDGVELKTRTPEGKVLVLKRSHGVVYVDEEQR